MHCKDECKFWGESEAASGYSEVRKQLDFTDIQISKILDFYGEANPDWNIDKPAIPLILDVACGNGQMTIPLSNCCRKIIGIDISAAQIELARKVTTQSNVEYEVGSALELSQFCAPGTVDLMTVGLAAHFFDCDEFYNEVRKCLRPGGVIAVVGQAMFGIQHAGKRYDSYIDDFHSKAPLNDTVRHTVSMLCDGYKNLYFPFKNVQHSEVIQTTEMTHGQYGEMIKSGFKALFDVKSIDELLEHLPKEGILTVFYKIFGLFGKVPSQ